MVLAVSDNLGRRSYDGDNIALLIGQLQSSLTSGFSSLNARLDHLSSRMTEHEKNDQATFDQFGRSIRLLEDEKMREEGATEMLRKMAEDARARTEEAKVRSDRNFKVLSAMIALLGIPGVLAFASRFL